jgi:hypothetical protein
MIMKNQKKPMMEPFITVIDMHEYILYFANKQDDGSIKILSKIKLHCDPKKISVSLKKELKKFILFSLSHTSIRKQNNI